MLYLHLQARRLCFKHVSNSANYVVVRRLNLTAPCCLCAPAEYGGGFLLWRKLMTVKYWNEQNSTQPEQNPIQQSFKVGDLNAVDVLRLALTSKVYGAAIETQISETPLLSARLGNRVLLKREDQQPIFSFKLRGAYNKMAHLSAQEKATGVITASAGNHAQGVAFAAQQLKVRAVIVMPVTMHQILKFRRVGHAAQRLFCLVIALATPKPTPTNCKKNWA